MRKCLKCVVNQDRVNTCPQFWRMILQEQVTSIVMLCKVQAGFSGCSQYFPDQTGDKIKDDITKTNVGTREVGEGVIVRDIEIEDPQGMFIF